MLRLFCTILLCTAASAGAIESMSLAAAIDHNGNETKSLLFGAQWRIRRGWFEDEHSAWRLRVDGTVAQHVCGRGQSDQQRLFDVGVAALFSVQRGGFYFEFGTGPHAVSGTVLGHQDLSSVFQMGSVFGLGYTVARWTIGYRYQHLSNGDIVMPNEGLDLHAVRLVRPF